ncbi:MAG: 4,5-DOPA dioxygenase extradiol [Crocinitomicaceae bacterium]|nr:4,5-DOPA dioxygenase extradiol [Crocinitomicaceae bacterium]
MDRKTFIQSLGILALTPSAMQLNELRKLADGFKSTPKMPVLFIGHGNPMNAIEENSFTKGWRDITKKIPTPNAILVISAHWETKGTYVTAMEKPKTIYDMYGFPQELYEVKYDCPGSPELAGIIKENANKANVHLDHSWGLDHGTWSVLVKMYPDANIPVLQLSIDRFQNAQYHYDLAKELEVLRNKGVLIIGSGNIVHNLRYASFAIDPKPYDWAVEFDEKAKELILSKEHNSLINYQDLGTAAQLSIPTPEHYLPLLYILAQQQNEDKVEFFNEEMAFASGSMRSIIIGQ